MRLGGAHCRTAGEGTSYVCHFLQMHSVCRSDSFDGLAMNFCPRLAAIGAFAVLAPLPALAGACDWIEGAERATVQLFFGRSIPGGGTVTESEWQDFLVTSVTPRFPDGFTALDGHGQWFEQKSHQVITEVSTVVEIVTPPTAEAYKKFQAIRTEYMKRFHQEAVGLVVSNGCASF